MILISGITGTVGVEVANLITESGLTVKAIVRNKSRAAFLEKKGIKLLEADLSNKDSLRRSIKGIEKIFLLTSNNPDLVQQEKNLIDISSEAEIKHIVKFSIIGADPYTNSRILNRHFISEKNLEKSRLIYTHIRPNLFMQNFLMFKNFIKNKHEFYLPFKKGRCAFVDVKDVARVIVKILSGKDCEKYYNKAFTLTGPDLLSGKEIAELFSTFLHQKVNYINISRKDFMQFLIKLRMSETLAEDYSNFYFLAGEGIFDKKTQDIKDITGKEPASFENFISDNIQYFK